MGHGRRRRRGSGGHPEKVAQRRLRDQRRRDDGPPEEAELARAIARAGSELGSAVDVEVFASHVLGTFESTRAGLPFTAAVDFDAALEYGEPLLRHLARIDDVGAALSVLGIAEVDGGELSLRAKELLDSANLWRRLPAWAGDVGESSIVGAAVMGDPVFDDGRTVFLESRHPDGQTIAVGVYIDTNLGGLAKDVVLAESIAEVDEIMQSNAEAEAVDLILEAVEPGIVAGLILDAIELTDMTLGAPVNEDFWAGRSLALLRVDQTPHLAPAPEPTELPQAERDALQGEFLSSAEGAGLSADSDGAWAVSVAIDFAADYAGGDPLRWSPASVELFMTGWVPNKVLSSESLVAVLPDALDAWVRFAARKRGVPDAALELTRAAISEYAAEMAEQVADPAAGGLATQFLRAAQQAGIDVGDQEALTGFMAGWNARSELDLGSADSVPPGTVSGADVVEVKITLKGVSKPPVWRRLQVPAATRLEVLHTIIQIAFGWGDSHLHAFELGGEQFGPADSGFGLDDMSDERLVTLSDLAPAVGRRLGYTYDFGDNWDHTIQIEKILSPDPQASYPILVKAKGACPVEDCGGPWGWAELKDAIDDPSHPAHDQLREWLGLADGESIDPTAVDVEQIHAGLAAVASSLVS